MVSDRRAAAVTQQPRRLGAHIVGELLVGKPPESKLLSFRQLNAPRNASPHACHSCHWLCRQCQCRRKVARLSESCLGATSGSASAELPKDLQTLRVVLGCRWLRRLRQCGTVPLRCRCETRRNTLCRLHTVCSALSEPEPAVEWSYKCAYTTRSVVPRCVAPL